MFLNSLCINIFNKLFFVFFTNNNEVKDRNTSIDVFFLQYMTIVFFVYCLDMFQWMCTLEVSLDGSVSAFQLLQEHTALR